MSHLQYTAKSHHLQWNVRQLSQICHHFYQKYCPDSFKHRRNVGLVKVSDTSLLVLLLLQAELGITSQRHFLQKFVASFRVVNYLREVDLIDGRDN